MKKDKIPAELYLKRVLLNWTNFCDTHRLIKKAIEEVLEENQKLKAQLKEKENE